MEEVEEDPRVDGGPVGPDMVVRLAYELYDERGNLVEQHAPEEPLEFVHGYAQVIPGLEEGLEGCEPGEAFSLEVEPEDAFGLRSEVVLEIDPNDFVDAEKVEVGSELVATGPDGIEATHRVIDVRPDAILVDLNHPLAGQRLRFELEVLGVRPATEEEIEAAYGDADERILHASQTFVYEGPGAESGPDAPGHRESVQPPAGLVQLRRGPSAKDEETS